MKHFKALFDWMPNNKFDFLFKHQNWQFDNKPHFIGYSSDLSSFDHLFILKNWKEFYCLCPKVFGVICHLVNNSFHPHSRWCCCCWCCCCWCCCCCCCWWCCVVVTLLLLMSIERKRIKFEENCCASCSSSSFRWAHCFCFPFIWIGSAHMSFILNAVFRFRVQQEVNEWEMWRRPTISK